MEQVHRQDRGPRGRAYLFLIPSLFLALCCHDTVAPTPTVMPSDHPDWYEPDAETYPDSVSACPEACARLRENGCPQGEPTPMGHSCTARCIQRERGKLVSYNPRCVARILPGPQACQAAVACEKLKTP